ncbi:MAG TPA: cytochrome C [Thermoanaerobaculia bacterium]|nr:cytochrome C [Thermoanaerobaculia bacterium]
MKLRPLLLLSLTACAFLVVLNDRSSAQGGAATASDDEAARIRIGFQVAPVPLSLADKDPNLVGLGSYIVNTRISCNDCHTNPPWVPGHNPHLGQKPAEVNAAAYLAGGNKFAGGLIVSRNITPDSHGLPAGLTFAQFVHTLRTGIDPDDPSNLLQIMPWPYFRTMSDHDLAAVYEYLRAIPSLPSAPGTPP